jgi:MFS family permease
VARIIDNMGSVVLPMIALILTQKIGFDESTAGLLASIFMISQAPFLLLGGKLADKIGCKKVIVIFNSLAAVLYLPCAFMQPSIPMALLIAFAANMFSTASPAINTIVTEIASPEQLNSSYSILYLGYNLGMAIGPAIGGILFNDHLQLLFVIDAVTCFISTVLIGFFVPNKGEQNRESSQVSDVKALANLKENVGSYKFLFKSPLLISFAVILLAYNFCYAQWGFMLPLQSASLFGKFGAQNYSMLVSVNAIAVIILTPILTSLTSKYRSLAIVAAGGLFYIMTFAMYGVGTFLYQFVIASIILTMGQVLININTNIFIAEQAPKNCIGRANSVLTIINGVGTAIGPVIMGYVIAAVKFTASWFIVALLMTIAAVGMFVLNYKSKIKTQA